MHNVGRINMLTKCTCPLGFLPLAAIYATLTRCQAPGVSVPETASQGSRPAARREAQMLREAKETDPRSGPTPLPCHTAKASVSPKMPSVSTRCTSQEPNSRANCYSLVRPYIFWGTNCPSGHFASVRSADTESPQKCPPPSGESTDPASPAQQDKHCLILGPRCLPSLRAP